MGPRLYRRDTTVGSSQGGLTVSATETVNLNDKIGGGALGLLAAAGASVGITNIHSNAEAYIASGATVSVAGNVTVNSTYFDNINVNSYGARVRSGSHSGPFTRPSTIRARRSPTSPATWPGPSR